MRRRRDLRHKTTRPLPSRETLMELLDYDPATGIFRWRATRGRAIRGAIAGTVMASGHIAISIGRRKFYAHRLAWKICKGKDPKGIVDHWDLDQANNRIRNLRDISQRENTTHRKMNKNNTSGFRGVFFVKATNKWGARILHQRKNIDLGSYDDPNEAHVTYLIASMMYHGRRYL